MPHAPQRTKRRRGTSALEIVLKSVRPRWMRGPWWRRDEHLIAAATEAEDLYSFAKDQAEKLAGRSRFYFDYGLLGNEPPAHHAVDSLNAVQKATDTAAGGSLEDAQHLRLPSTQEDVAQPPCIRSGFLPASVLPGRPSSISCSTRCRNRTRWFGDSFRA